MTTLAPLGLGTAAIGNLFSARTDDEAVATVVGAIDAAIGFIDTAPLYGFGLAERRVGVALKQAQAHVALSTKVGRVLTPVAARATDTDQGFVDADPFVPMFDYTSDGVARSLESSLHRLNTDQVDLVLVHDLGARTHHDQHGARLREALDGAFPRLSAWKREGVIARYGVGVNETTVVDELLTHTDIDVVLLAGRHTLLDRSACADGFFDRCAASGVSIILGGALNSGILVDPDAAGAVFDYSPAPLQLRAHARAMAKICAGFGVPLAAAALAFCRKAEGVERVLIGPGTPSELAQCLAWAGTPIPQELWPALEALA
jgi:D-threo-aldose 1-dehydrogenase